ncbi:Uncharacterised protein [Mycobacteroides abscessus subsp. abscessus]|nr:Uncharacterised protein [Mycobacteroides abscessus subsp. abscessus]
MCLSIIWAPSRVMVRSSRPHSSNVGAVMVCRSRHSGSIPFLLAKAAL